jgi:hypothetical protein
MNRATLLAAGLAGALLVAAMPAEAACWRHIVNRSSKPWSFRAAARALAGSDDNKGNAWFYDCQGQAKGAAQRNGTCTVAAGRTARIKYTHSQSVIRGDMVISDHKGASRSFEYYAAMSRCPYIEHSGNTGAVAVNDPARGDWNAWGDQW